MTLKEFKAWFEGFTEELGDIPNERQFARIKERVSEIDDTSISREVIERHYHDYRKWYPPTPYWMTERTPSVPPYTTICQAMGKADATSLSATT